MEPILNKGKKMVSVRTLHNKVLFINHEINFGVPSCPPYPFIIIRKIIPPPQNILLSVIQKFINDPFSVLNVVENL